MPELVDDLLNLLSIDGNLLASRTGIDEIDAPVSLETEDAMVLMLLLRAWQLAHPDVALELS